MELSEAVRWATRLAAPEHRVRALDELAQAAGAEHALLLVGDKAGRVMLPAPGLRQTLPRGARWRELLHRLWDGGSVCTDVEAFLGPGLQKATARSSDGVAIVLLGGDPVAPMLEGLQPLWPMLGQLLDCEQCTRTAMGELRTARSEMRQYAAQAQVLDETRFKLDETVRKLGEEARRAADASRAKDEFLAMLGHELRNPLAPIVLTLEVLRMRDAWRPELDVVERQVHHMKRLMDDLLDVARIARGKLVLDKGPVDLAEVLVQARESAPEWASRQHPLRWDVAADGLHVLGDRARLVQVFSNLLDNAAKYSDPGSEIHVRASSLEGRKVLVDIRDRGIGLAPGQLEGVFEMFEQGGRSGAFAGGLGLGLAIVRNIVKHHGGRVWAESEGRGHGSTFRVELPLLAESRHADVPAVPTVHGRMPGLRVMTVDDNDDARTTLGWMLEHYGCAVLEMPGGAEALAHARSFQPEIAVLDLGMPGMDGMTLARRLRDTMGERTPYLVALSGFGQPSDKALAFEAGFNDYLVKPVALDDLQRALERARAAGRAPPVAGR
jgi:signal transduction histidine kinase/ActR/RegA family two-component response regulator